MICPKCGTDNEDIARFCQSCGSKIEQPQPQPKVIEPAPVVTSFEDPLEAMSSDLQSNNEAADGMAEIKKYWMLLAIAPLAFLSWLILERIPGVWDNDTIYAVSNIIYSSAWGLMFSSLAITIWNRSKRFIAVWSAACLVSALLYAIIERVSIPYELIVAVVVICSGSVAYAIKKFAKVKCRPEIIVAISACGSVLFIILVLPIFYALYFELDYSISIGISDIAMLAVGFFGVKLFKKVGCFQ